MRRLNRLLASASVALCAALSACTKPDPTFRAADVIAADGLVGEWVEQKEEAQSATRLVITADPQPRDGERVARRSTDAGQLADQLKKGSVPAYAVTAVIPKSQAPGEAGAAHPLTMTLRGYLISTPGDPVLCLQNDTSVGEDAGSVAAALFSTPTTMFMRVRVEGDTLTVTPARVMIHLLTDARPLDDALAPSDGSSPKVERVLTGDKDGGESFYTCDPDRAVALFRHYAPRAEFWEDSAMTMMRVRK